MFKKLLVAATLVLATMMAFGSVTSADEGDVLPKEQQACYEQAPVVNRMELVVPAEKKPGVNYDSHYLNDEDAGKLSSLSYITPETVIIKLFAGIGTGDFVRIHDDLRKIEDYTDLRDITMVIRSGGGSAFDGMAIADLINKYQRRGFTIRAEGYGMIASAAVPIFAQCKPRAAVDGTFFMVHEAAMFKWPGRETAADIKSQDAMMTKLGERYVDLMVRNSTTSAEDWKSMIKVTTWMTAQEAMATGIIDTLE
jgi:ATP-dependent protease ClpP protease subunit